MSKSFDIIAFNQAVGPEIGILPPGSSCYPIDPNDPLYYILTVASDGTVTVQTKSKTGSLAQSTSVDITSNLQNHGWYHAKLKPPSKPKQPKSRIDIDMSIVCKDGSGNPITVKMIVLFQEGGKVFGGWSVNDKLIMNPFNGFLKEVGWSTCEDQNIPEYAIKPCCPTCPSRHNEKPAHLIPMSNASQKTCDKNTGAFIGFGVASGVLLIAVIVMVVLMVKAKKQST